MDLNSDRQSRVYRGAIALLRESQGFGRRASRVAARRRRHHQNIHHLLAMLQIIIGMQCGEFNGDAGIARNIPARGSFGDLRNRIGIGHMVASCVLVGDRRFPQHVVAIQIAFCLKTCRAAQRFLDGLSQDKLLPHFADDPCHGLADDRLAEAFDGPAQKSGHACVGRIQHLSRDQKRPS